VLRSSSQSGLWRGSDLSAVVWRLPASHRNNATDAFARPYAQPYSAIASASAKLNRLTSMPSATTASGRGGRRSPGARAFAFVLGPPRRHPARGGRSAFGRIRNGERKVRFRRRRRRTHWFCRAFWRQGDELRRVSERAVRKLRARRAKLRRSNDRMARSCSTFWIVCVPPASLSINHAWCG
jgi:hypothetical protein